MGCFGLLVASDPRAACIMCTWFIMVQPTPRLLLGNLGKVDGIGVGEFMMGLEKLILGLWPWFGGRWLYPENLGGMFTKT